MVAASALGLPLALMRVHLDEAPTRAYCLVVTVSMLALLPGLTRAVKAPLLSFRDCWIALASFTGTIGAVWLVLVAQGLSSYTIVSAIVLFNLKAHFYGMDFYGPLPMGPRWIPGALRGSIWIPWTLGGLAAAVMFNRWTTREPGKAYELLAPVKLIMGSVTLLLAAVPTLAYGIDHQVCCGALWGPAMLFGFVTPFCWLLLYSPAEDITSRQAFPRILLATAAVLQTLIPYPVTGSQTALIRPLLVAAGGVFLGDFLSAKSASYRLAAVTRSWIARYCPMRTALRRDRLPGGARLCGRAEISVPSIVSSSRRRENPFAGEGGAGLPVAHSELERTLRRL